MVHFACGLEHTAVIDNSGHLWTFGSNVSGQLGIEEKPSFLSYLWNETEGNPTRPTKIQEQKIPTKVQHFENEITHVSCGAYYTCCIDINGEVWSFGSNVTGQLGLGYPSSYLPYPKKIDFSIEMIEITCGSSHTMCLDRNSNVWSFGYNLDGQLGIGSHRERKIHLPRKLSELENIQKIACGSNHTICLSFSGAAFAFGSNVKGQLNLGDCVNRYSPTLIDDFFDILEISCCSDCSEFLLQNGSVYVCGSSDSKEAQCILRKRENLYDIKMIASGVNHTLFLDYHGSLWSTLTFVNSSLHENEESNEESHQDYVISIVGIPNVCQIFAGGMHSFVLDSEQNIWSLGFNHAGQLGLEHNDPVTEFTRLDSKYSSLFGFRSTPCKSARK